MVTIVEYLFSNGCCFGHRKKAAMTPKLQPLLPNHNRESTLTFKFKGSNILSVENLASLGRILKGLFQTKERPLILSRIHETPKSILSATYYLTVSYQPRIQNSSCKKISPSRQCPETKHRSIQVAYRALTRSRTDQLPTSPKT